MTFHLLYYSPKDVRLFKYRSSSPSELTVAKNDWNVKDVTFNTKIENYSLVLYNEQSKPRSFEKHASVIIVSLFIERFPMYYVRNIIIPTYTMSVVRSLPEVHIVY